MNMYRLNIYRFSILRGLFMYVHSCKLLLVLFNFSATEPSTKQRQVSTKKEDFSVSSDGKFIIKDEEENIDENNAEKSLDIGRKDILAGQSNTLLVAKSKTSSCFMS